MGIRLILVAAHDDLRRLYCQKIAEFDLRCDVVTSLRELFHRLQETPYNGLLIDLSTSIKADKAEKSLAQEFIPLYPTLNLKWDEKSQDLCCMQIGSISNSGISLASFIEYHCRPFQARRIRKEKRLQLNFNALLSADSKVQGLDVERSTTLDISKGGCSLFTCQKWPVGSRIWLIIIELEDQTPIEAEVRRWVCWGTPMAIPSIGVCFQALTPSQTAQLGSPEKIWQPHKVPVVWE